MNIAKKKAGITIGALSTIVSLLLTATYIVPIIAVLPGALVESIVSNYVNNEPYSNVGVQTILILSLIFLIALIACLVWIGRLAARQGYNEKEQIIFVMIIMFFPLHSLGFYIYWGAVLDFRSDGQLIFSAIISVPISSFVFILIGLLIDLLRNNRIANFQRKQVLGTLQPKLPNLPIP